MMIPTSLICLWKVFALLDEFFLGGELQETSKKVILDRMQYLAEIEKKA